MNKPQVVWLITRLIGVYFGYWAIIAALSFVGAVYNYVSVPSATTTAGTNSNTNIVRTPVPTPTIRIPGIELPKSEAEKAAEKVKSETGKEIFWQLFLSLAYGAVAFYLIRNGKHLFAVLNCEESVEASNEFPASMPLPQRNDEAVTPLNAPIKKEEVTSLNLSEYVPKSNQPAPPEIKVEETKTPEISVEQPQTEIDVLTDERNPLDLPPEISSADDEQTPVNEQIATPINKRNWKDLEIAPPYVSVETPDDEQKT